MTQMPLMLYKDALTSYARLLPLMRAAIARCRMCEGSQSVRGLDDALIGFMAHSHVSKSVDEARDTGSQT